MRVLDQSAGDSAVSVSTAETRALPQLRQGPAVPLPLRAEYLTLTRLVDLYLTSYAGRDRTRLQRLSWWVDRYGDLTMQDITDDLVHTGLEELAAQPSRYYAGKDANGRSIFKSKHRPVAAATVNRYAAALGAVLTWAIKKRIAPKGYVHPCRTVERRREDNEKTRFLSDDERRRLLEACRSSKWPRLYLLVLLALTTGARKSELLNLKWSDLDLERGVAYCARTKNGDARALPLLSGVLEELRLIATGRPSSELIFRSRKSPARPYSMEGRWRAALKLGKIRDFRFHDLRHTCASMLAQNGATLLEIGDVLGHRQLQVTKRYSHLTTQHKAALVKRVLGEIR